MVRSLTLFVALALMAPALMVPAATAQPGPPDADDARFQFTQVGDGYLRLDLKSGQVSLCGRRAVGWACQTVADDRAALEQEIARLQKENVALKKELLTRGVPLPDGVKPQAGRDGGGDVKAPGNADIDRMMSAFERVWRRVIEMIGSLQKDMMNKT